MMINVWDPHNITSSSKLVKNQRRATRLIFYEYRRIDSPTRLCKLTNLPSLESRTLLDRSPVIFHIIRDYVKITKSDYFEISTSDCSRHRHSTFITKPSVRNAWVKISFLSRALKESNALPDKAMAWTSPSYFYNASKILFDEHYISWFGSDIFNLCLC